MAKHSSSFILIRGPTCHTLQARSNVGTFYVRFMYRNSFNSLSFISDPELDLRMIRKTNRIPEPGKIIPDATQNTDPRAVTCHCPADRRRLANTVSGSQTRAPPGT